ncbi:MAG: hypothetical protein RJA07_1818 [Bacteroidota bacterium]|jgi:hypothetical protein
MKSNNKVYKYILFFSNKKSSSYTGMRWINDTTKLCPIFRTDRCAGVTLDNGESKKTEGEMHKFVDTINK